MYLKRLYQTVNKVMCHWINRTCHVLPHWYSLYGSIWGPKKCIILYYRPNWRLCLQSARYKFCNLTSFILLRRKIKNINDISSKFIMLTDNNQIFRNWFIIIHCHLTKDSAQIIHCRIFERNELSITSYSMVHHS